MDRIQFTIKNCNHYMGVYGHRSVSNIVWIKGNIEII